MANRPAVQAWLKSKDTGKNIQIAAFWDGEFGLSGKFDECVKEIIIENATGEKMTIRPEQVYLNGKLETQYLATAIVGTDEDGGKSSESADVPPPATDEVPF